MNGTSEEGIYYQYEFNQTSSTYKLYVEYLLSDYELDSNPNKTPPPLYHYIVAYDASLPGAISFYYFQNSSTVTHATTGIQGASSAGGRFPLFHIRLNPLSILMFALAIHSITASHYDILPGIRIDLDTLMGNGTVTWNDFNYFKYPAGTFPEGICTCLEHPTGANGRPTCY